MEWQHSGSFFKKTASVHGVGGCDLYKHSHVGRQPLSSFLFCFYTINHVVNILSHISLLIDAFIFKGQISRNEITTFFFSC